MKCYTVTENGVSRGIGYVDQPYAHVLVGDPRSEADLRRVALDETLRASVNGAGVERCSMTFAANDEDRRRASYRLVPPTDRDDDRALVKLEVKAPAGSRTWYDLPRETFVLAKGWVLEDGSGPRVNAPVELVVLKPGDEVRVYESNRSGDPRGVLKLTVRLEGGELQRK